MPRRKNPILTFHSAAGGLLNGQEKKHRLCEPEEILWDHREPDVGCARRGTRRD